MRIIDFSSKTVAFPFKPLQIQTVVTQHLHMLHGKSHFWLNISTKVKPKRYCKLGLPVDRPGWNGSKIRTKQTNKLTGLIWRGSIWSYMNSTFQRLKSFFTISSKLKIPKLRVIQQAKWWILKLSWFNSDISCSLPKSGVIFNIIFWIARDAPLYELKTCLIIVVLHTT